MGLYREGDLHIDHPGEGVEIEIAMRDIETQSIVEVRDFPGHQGRPDHPEGLLRITKIEMTHMIVKSQR